MKAVLAVLAVFLAVTLLPAVAFVLVGGRLHGCAPGGAAARPDTARGVPAVFRRAVHSAAAAHEVPAPLLAGLVRAESGWDPTARSSAGAYGLTQLMPYTADALGVDVSDPVEQLDGGARYLGEQLDEFGSVELALAAYNAGPGAVLAAGRAVPDHPETLAYVPRVLEYAEEYRGPPAGMAMPPGEPSEGIGDGAWGGHANGRIPPAALAPVAPGERLRADAAAAWQRMTAAHRAGSGRPIGITDTYRSYGQQVELAAYKGALAATPGTSNHGWGLAVDLVVPGGYDDPTYRWLQANGARFGWVNPDWAREGGSKPEPWHWEFVGGRGLDAASVACLAPTPRGAQPSGRRAHRRTSSPPAMSASATLRPRSP
ncbi:hypothetical protein BH20ACT9_BH20ACT9_10410 [soil metagenome]